MGDNSKAKTYLTAAIEAFMKLNSLWGRSTAYGYMALLLIKENKYEEALSHLKKAERFADLMQNPYEIALIYRVKAEIRKGMDFNSKLKMVFSTYLTNQAMEYCDKGIVLLSEIKNCYELDILRNLAGSW
jgi:tetratricopeptide (TPR) repeat protein